MDAGHRELHPLRNIGAMVTNPLEILGDHQQIQCIEMIPETKVVMVNRDYFLVKETAEEIIDKIANYSAKVQDIYREVSVVDKR